MRICVIGAGTRFLSGMSYYTLQLANAFAADHTNEVSAVLMRQLLPTRLYPGRERVGLKLSELDYDPSVAVCDGVDWYWWPSLLKSMRFLLRQRPQVVMMQWWSGTVLHTYLMLALFARLLGARVIIEFHEVLDPAEAAMPLVSRYVRLIVPFLVRLANGFIIHSEQDRPVLNAHYSIGNRPVALIPLGPYKHGETAEEQKAFREAPADCTNLLFFGLIRPYKGLDDLIKAFNSLEPQQVQNYWLTVVGETWEDWNEPARLIAASPYSNRISFVNRYVSDAEVAAFFAGADAVVFPYRRSSGSGALNLAMGQGLPVAVSKVGGLVEVVRDYSGAVLVPPGDIEALRESFQQLAHLRGQIFNDPHSWETNLQRYQELCSQLGLGDQSLVQPDEPSEEEKAVA